MLEGRLPRTRSGLTSQFVCVDHLKIVGEALAGVVPRHALHGHREGGAPLEQLGMRRSGRRVGRVRHRPRQRHVQLPAWAKVPRARAHARRVARCHRPRHCAAREVVLIAINTHASKTSRTIFEGEAMAVSLPASTVLDDVMPSEFTRSFSVSGDGTLTVELGPRDVAVLVPR